MSKVKTKKKTYLLDGFKGMKRYWKLKEKALYCKFFRTRFGRGSGQIVSQPTDRNNSYK